MPSVDGTGTSAEHVPAVFTSLRPEEMSRPMERLFAYMDDTWITGKVWQPVDWSVFMMTVRTDNDVEGWHLRLNNRGKRGTILNLYLTCANRCQLGPLIFSIV